MPRKILYLALILAFGLSTICISCGSDKTDTSSEDTTQKEHSEFISDYKPNPAAEYVDLLFAQQTWKEIKQLAPAQPGETDSILAIILKAGNELEKNAVYYESGKLSSVRGAAQDNFHTLIKICFSPKIPTRYKLWAGQVLREFNPPNDGGSFNIMGVIIEVPMENTTEYLAIYEDSSVQYVNYTGNIGASTGHNPTLDSMISLLLKNSEQYIKTEKLDRQRFVHETQNIRFNFITAHHGIYQTEKAMSELKPGSPEPAGIFSLAEKILVKLVSKK